LVTTDLTECVIRGPA